MTLTSISCSPSTLRLNSSEESQGRSLLDDITSSLQGSGFMNVDDATKKTKVENPSSEIETEYLSIEPNSSEISNIDNRTSEKLIRKTDIGLAHASIGTRKADTKISYENLTQTTDIELAYTKTEATDVSIGPIYDDILNSQNAISYDDNDCTKIEREPIYASIRREPEEELIYTDIETINNAPKKPYSYIPVEQYKDVEKMKASGEIKRDKYDGLYQNSEAETCGDNETYTNIEFDNFALIETTKYEKELWKHNLSLIPGNGELNETIQYHEEKIEKLQLKIKNLEFLLWKEKEKNLIQTVKYEILQNTYEAMKQHKSVSTSETQTVDMNDKNQHRLELLEEIESPSKDNALNNGEEIAITADVCKENQSLISNNLQQDSLNQAEFATDDKVNDLLTKNECLHFQIEQLSIQLNKVYNQFMMKESEESVDSGQDRKSQLSPTQQKNDLLTLELKQLKEDYLHLQKEQKDLVHAGDILQEDYEKLHEEHDKIQDILGKLTNYQGVTKNEISILEIKNVIQEVPENISPDGENWEQKLDLQQGEQNITNINSDTDIKACEHKKPELLEGVIKEKYRLRRNYTQLDANSSEVIQDQSIILNELQTLRDENKKVFMEKELEISFNENSDLKQKLNTTIEDYRLLEKNYAILLLEKQNMPAKDFLKTQNKSSVGTFSGLNSNSINDSGIQLHSNLQEEIQLLPCQPNEMSIKNNDDDNSQQTASDKGSMKQETNMQKEKQIESLQILISKLQQQLRDSEKRNQEIVQTYRLHLISAIQGHIDPDVKKGLFSIIELRSLEKFC